MVGVTKWSYKQSAIDERQDNCDFYGDPSEMCKNEAWFMRELSQQLEDKFNINRTLTYAFMDSYSQLGPNLDDEVQQEYWIKETDKLWNEGTGKNETFDFKTIDDVLEENAACKKENERLLDIIDEEIANLQDDVRDVKESAEHNEDSISSLSMSVTLNTNQIMDNIDTMSNVSTRVGENKAAVEDNTDAIDLLSMQGTYFLLSYFKENIIFKILVDILPMVPIGTILPWVMRLEGGVNADIPDGWVRCDGSAVLDHNGSIWAGLTVPNLNGERRFLRGGLDEDVLNLEDDQMQDHLHEFNDPGHAHIYSATNTYQGCRGTPTQRVRLTHTHAGQSNHANTNKRTAHTTTRAHTHTNN